MTAEVAVEEWEMMDEHNCLLAGPKFLHYFWAIALMKTYPNNDKALLIALEGSNPKTIRKYICLFINLIF